MPAGGGEAGLLVGRGRKLGAAVDGDAVVIPEHDHPAEFQMARKVDGLMGNPLHQAAVAGDDIGVMVHQVGPEAGVQHAFGQRHADGGADALTQRAGRGLDPLGMAVFRVPRRAGAELAKGLKLAHRHVVVAEQVVDRIDQHGTVPRAHHEAVAVGPPVVLRVDRNEAVEQHGRHVGHAHRRAGMAGVGLLHRIHGKGADGVGHEVFGGSGDGGLNGHRILPQARLDSWTRRWTIGVKISCMARSILPPGITMELARLIQEFWIIEVR